MTLVFVENPDVRKQLLPLTFTRPATELRTGLLTLRERWQHFIPANVTYRTEGYLQPKFSREPELDPLFIAAHLLPDAALAEAIRQLKEGEALLSNGVWLASRTAENPENSSSTREYTGEVTWLSYPWEIFQRCGKHIEMDFHLLTEGKTSEALSPSNRVIGDPSRLFLAPGAKAEGAIFNTTDGPIYLAAGSEVMEGSLVRGPFGLGEHSQLKMGAKIYGPTSFGPHCKVGGEVNNAVIQAYSSKAHDGFLGNAVIGEWCNLGADTNNSNLKNNYAPVKIYSYVKGGFIQTGLQFCGLIMGDHSKTAINTMLNTGTVIGISANIFGDGFPRNYVPSFSWGGAAGFKDYPLNEAIQTARLVFARRNLEFDEIEEGIFRAIYRMEIPS